MYLLPQALGRLTIQPGLTGTVPGRPSQFVILSRLFRKYTRSQKMQPRKMAIISQHENINCELNFSEFFDEIKNIKEFLKKVFAKDKF